MLSVGSEESKGNELTRDAHQLLKSAPIEFVGNVEGRDVYAGDVDVIVCDGFTGNVTLKISEGLVETVERLLHTSCRRRSARASATCCRDRRSADFASAWTPPSTAVRRSSG